MDLDLLRGCKLINIVKEGILYLDVARSTSG